ncbi:hypothetical protein EG329_011990 [Mollisiaceae sp. DMI_Dod_QoI]|nr:hypothetical protein EG329_011990 [Helotiales sp. DMI_Dod_QoI]
MKSFFGAVTTAYRVLQVAAMDHKIKELSAVPMFRALHAPPNPKKQRHVASIKDLLNTPWNSQVTPISGLKQLLDMPWGGYVALESPCIETTTKGKPFISDTPNISLASLEVRAINKDHTLADKVPEPALRVAFHLNSFAQDLVANKHLWARRREFVKMFIPKNDWHEKMKQSKEKADTEEHEEGCPCEFCELLGKGKKEPI